MGKYCSECGNPRLETFRDYEARTVVEQDPESYQTGRNLLKLTVAKRNLSLLMVN